MMFASRATPTRPATTNGLAQADFLVILAVMLFGVALKLLLLHPVGPMLFFDELLYRQGADAIAHLTRYPSGQYPFLYPLSIAPAIALGIGYQGIVFTNILLTSMLVPACFLLAREVGMRRPWIAGVAAALLPVQFAFPTQVLSENLFVPAFAWVVWYAIRAKPTTMTGAFGFGIALGSLMLIRYMALPALPLIFAFWLLGLSAVTGNTRGGALVRPAVACLAGTVSIICVWLAYAHFNGIGIREALGSKASGLATGHLSEKMTRDSFTMWATAYAAAAALIAGPFLPEILHAVTGALRRPGMAFRGDAFERTALLAVMLLGGYWLVASLHSAGAFYNYPKPQYLIERYLMHVAPLVVVLGLAGISREKPRHLALGIALISIPMLLLAHAILFRQFAWSFPKWFAALPLYSSDLLPFATVVAVALACLLVATRVFLRPTGSMTAVWIVGFLALQLLGAKAISDKMASVHAPAHARALYPVVQGALATNARVAVLDDIRDLKPSVLRQGLIFWGVDERRIRVVQYKPGVVQGVPGDTKFLITDKTEQGHAVLTYNIAGGQGRIYRLQADDSIAR